MSEKMILEVKHDGFNTHLVNLELDCLPFEKANSRADISNSLDTILSMKQFLLDFGYIKTFGNQTDYEKINKFLKGVLFLNDEQIEKMLKDFTEKALDRLYEIGEKKLKRDFAEEKISEKEFNLISLRKDYSKFQNLEKVLLENKIMQESVKGYDWLKSKISLAEFFNYLDTSKNLSVENISNVFTVKGKPIKGLSQSFQNASSNGSPDFKIIKEIIKEFMQK